jgi:hypothetical protein
MTDRKTLEKRLANLELKLKPIAMVGIMPDGSTKFFDWKKILNLQFEIWGFEEIAPKMADFKEEDQIFMKEFLRAKFTDEAYMPFVRQCFGIVEKSDLGLYEIPLEKFIEPMNS